MGTYGFVGVSASLLMVGCAVVATIVLLVLGVAVSATLGDPAERRVTALATMAAAALKDQRPRVRLVSRLLFTRRQPDSITLDCLLVAVEEAAPGIEAPCGMPFTLQLRAPETAWFATRVEQLLAEWAADSRELMLELSEDHGRVRTKIASHGTSVNLELAGAAGLHLSP